MERVIVWHRWSPTAEPSREASTLGVSFRHAARTRFLQVDAEVLNELGGTVVFALDLLQLTRAIELCLGATREAEREESGAGGISCGIAVGSLERGEEGSYVGDVLDRAQALAHAGGANEVVLDAGAQTAASHVFLFAREVSTSFGLAGAVLDRAFPRISECQRALAHLGRPPFPINGASQFESLRRLARGTGRHRVLLVGPHGVGIGQWIARIAGEVGPPLWLDVRALGASLAPLSGLMYALRRLPTAASPEHVLTRADEPDQHASATLAAIRAGRSVSRRDAIVALRQYIGRVGEAGRRAIVSVDPAPMIDPSSVGVIAEAAREGGPDALIIMRLLLESKPPEAFSRGGGLAEIRMRGLSLHEARTLASNMLGGGGNDAPNDLARRAVAMGGGNPLAVATALRVLVAAGDIVYDPTVVGSAATQASDVPTQQGGFRWRRGPAGRLDAMSLDALLEERLDALAAPLRRALEVLAAIPDPDDRELAGEVAQVDGLMEETWVRAVEELDVLGLVSFDTRGIGLSPALRQVVLSAMAPQRALALHGFIADALGKRITERDDFARATLAYYLAHAGKMSEAATIFLEVAACAGQLGFIRSGVRLAAAAVECDPSDDTRARAARIAEKLSERKEAAARGSRPSVSISPGPIARPAEAQREVTPLPPADLAAEASARAVQAILARDFDEVDRAIELLVAAGRDSAAVDRLRTVTLLVKGEHSAATSLLQRLHEASGGAPSARLGLTGALVSIASGNVALALRACLQTLARTREARDVAGERACLSVLATCYQRLGRDRDAARLASAALATPPTGQRAHG